MSLLRGAIEGVTQDAIYGWLYSSVEKLRDRVVLAYCREACIGSGNVGLYREDLMTAGLGDGYLGFHFGITYVGATTPDEVVVKLEGSDVVLLQPGSRISRGTNLDREIPTEDRLGSVLSSLKWQLSNRLIEQSTYDFLKTIWRFGVHEQMLWMPSRDSGGTQAQPAEVVERLMSFYVLDKVVVESEQTVTTNDEYKAEIDRLRALPDSPCVVALWSSGRAALRAIEGSHLHEDQQRSRDMRGAVTYRIRPEQLVFVDVRAQTSLDVSGDEVVIYSVRRKPA